MRTAIRSILSVAACVLAGACESATPGTAGAPRVRIFTPAAGTVTAQPRVHVTGEAEHPLVVRRVWFRVNGGPEQRVDIRPGTRVPFEFDVPVADGSTRVEVLAGGFSQTRGTAAVSLLADRDPPAVEILSPDSLVGAARLALRAHVADATGVVRATWRLDGGPETDAALGAASGGEREVTATIPAAHGTHRLEVAAYDAAGNAGTAVRLLRVDTVPPQVAITYPAGSGLLMMAVFRLTGWARDAGGLTRVAVEENGSEVATVPVAGDSADIRFPLTLEPYDTASIVAVAYDRAGNRGTSGPREIALIPYFTVRVYDAATGSPLTQAVLKVWPVINYPNEVWTVDAPLTNGVYHHWDDGFALARIWVDSPGYQGALAGSSPSRFQRNDYTVHLQPLP